MPKRTNATKMNIFKSKRKSLTITEKDPTHKVLYLGNVHTAMMKGEGCVDKPVNIIWKNYERSASAGKDMELTVTAYGMKVKTRDQGFTEYRAHRITYVIAPPQYPKLFVWVYRHEGKKMKVDLRCHAVLCKNESKAKAIAVMLHEKLSLALRAFMTEKNSKQRARLLMQRTKSLPKPGGAMPLRKKLLSTAENFKPSVEKSSSAPKLNDISEGVEPEDYEADDRCAEANCACMLSLEEEEDEFDPEDYVVRSDLGSVASDSSSGDAVVLQDPMGDDTESDFEKDNDVVDDLDLLQSRIVALEVGNDIDKLKNDQAVLSSMQNPDSDVDDADSGFSEQKETT
ncbi:protein FAM43A-like [Lineus longissimus]|uniref:protein FAM43A-like n=1 Tax=Lineus longissimus TaxID=88925 RepID=UPI002B4EB287